ncbi:MAG TPA: hypothetical protein VHZ24_12090 [Pirellulales bacterium]|jgi:hypothetical protein|nr:hypothetical protein [Pirellulales bacterium]
MNRMTILALLLLPLGQLAARADDPSAPRPRHLFLDPAFIDESDGVALHANPPQRRDVVIRHDRPWEKLMISFFLTVLDERDKLRMWYICRDAQNRPNVAYAESTDGLAWTKPNMGIVDYDGSTANNLVGMSSLEGVVFRDPNAKAEERYAYCTHLIDEGIVRFHSPDGLRWSRDAQPLLRLGADTQNVTLWDDRLGQYVLYLRGWEERADGKLYRKVVRAATSDITRPMSEGPSGGSRYLWGKEKMPVIDREFPTVFATDEHDPPDSDVYNLSAQRYPLDPRWYLGFPSLFQRERNRSDGKLEVQFTGGRDGIHWHRYDRVPYAALGLADSDSQNMTFMGTGMVVRGDEIWQYGTGFHSRHGDVAARKLRTDGIIYRYTQRLDGFVSLDFDSAGGSCRTAPVKLDGPRLHVNVDTGALGTLRVALLDAAGEPIAGYTLDDCRVLRTNATRAVVAWRAGDDLTSLAGQQVRLALVGARAKLYSFMFDGGP